MQEACAKCFAVQVLKFEILQITWEKWNKEHQTHSFQFFSYRFWCFLFCFSCGLQDFKFRIWRKLLVLSWLYLWRHWTRIDIATGLHEYLQHYSHQIHQHHFSKVSSHLKIKHSYVLNKIFGNQKFMTEWGHKNKINF